MALIDNIYGYFEKNQELKVLFIFDPMESVHNEIKDAEWREGYKYVVFEGNWFATKYALEYEWCKDKVVLLLKMSCPEDKEAKAKFPLMDLLVANAEFKSESHEAFMQQNGIPVEHTELVRKHIAELQLEKFNRMLKGYYGTSFNKDVAYRGLLSVYLGENKMLTWYEIIVKLFIIDTNLEDAKRIKVFHTITHVNDVLAALQSKLAGMFGATMNVDAEYKMTDIAQKLKYNLLTQLMPIENADNYKHLKVTNALMIEQFNLFYEYTSTLNPKTKALWSKAFDSLASGIKESEIIKVYSVNAQYFHVTTALCWEIIKAILTEQIIEDPEGAMEKVRMLMLKQRENNIVYPVLQYVSSAVSFYHKKRSLGSLILNTPDEYISKYTSDYCLLDLHYRKSLEHYLNLPIDAPVLHIIETVKEQLDKDYASITNLINIEWVKCLKEKGNGFGEISVAKKQEDFYKTEKRPTKLAVIISDALRYEVAKELVDELHGSRHTASLSAGIAMLPTETKYCKPALLPHQSMTLYNDTLGIDNTILDSLEKRDAHVKKYIKNAACVSFDTVQGNNQAQNRSLFQNPLVYVFHDTIDHAGHDGSRGTIINACSQSVNELAKMVNRIHSTYNVKDVIITADHGFLYNDMTFAENDKTQITEVTMEQKSRYYLTESCEDVINVVKFPVSNVSGIEDNSMYVAVPIGTNRFKVQGADYNFVHGGASMQELIIPIIYSSLERTDEKRKVDVSLLTRNLSIVSSRMKVQIFQNEAISAENKERTIVCAIYCNDEKVSNEQTIILNSNDSDVLQNRIYELHLMLNQTVDSGILQLRVYDVDDMLNPLIKETVTNNTLIDQDF